MIAKREIECSKMTPAHGGEKGRMGISTLFLPLLAHEAQGQGAFCKQSASWVWGMGKGSEVSVKGLQVTKKFGGCSVCHSRKRLEVLSKRVDTF